MSLLVFLGWHRGLRAFPPLPLQPVTRGRRLCGEDARSSTKSVPVQIARPWQAAGDGFTAGRHMQGTPGVPRGTQPPAADAATRGTARPGERRCCENELLACSHPWPRGTPHCRDQRLLLIFRVWVWFWIFFLSFGFCSRTTATGD